MLMARPSFTSRVCAGGCNRKTAAGPGARRLIDVHGPQSPVSGDDNPDPERATQHEATKCSHPHGREDIPKRVMPRRPSDRPEKREERLKLCAGQSARPLCGLQGLTRVAANGVADGGGRAIVEQRTPVAKTPQGGRANFPCERVTLDDTVAGADVVQEKVGE